jgi:NADH-quinone oxidoreductase subunit J
VVDPIILIFGLIVAGLAVNMALTKAPIAAALSLIALMVALGGIYAMVGAHFVAALQVLIYAGAIMVLFVFSIMLLNRNEEYSEIDAGNAKAWLTGILSLSIFGMIYWGFKCFTEFEGRPLLGEFTLERIREIGGNLEAVSALMFSRYFFHFEVISLLLLVAVIAALVLAKRKVDEV